MKPAKSSEEIAAIAKQNGHEFNTDTITEPSDAELEGVAGTALVTLMTKNGYKIAYGTCHCW